MTEEIPRWSWDRAYHLSCVEYNNGNIVSPAISALARYIAQHDQPPVDPDLEKAREICAQVERNPQLSIAYLEGDLDNRPQVQFVLSTLKEIRNSK